MNMKDRFNLETDGFVELMNPHLRDNLLDALEAVYLDWKERTVVQGPVDEFEMHESAKQDLLNFLEYHLEQI